MSEDLWIMEEDARGPGDFAILNLSGAFHYAKIPEILVGIQMKRFVFGFFCPEYSGSPLGSGGGPHIRRSIYDKSALCPIKFGNSEGIVPI